MASSKLGQLVFRRCMGAAASAGKGQVTVVRQKIYVPQHDIDSQRFWFRVFFYGWVPALLAGGYYNIILNPEDHDPPEFTKLPYLRIRPKRGLPYGDGNHNLIFNPHVNPLPDGFEEGYGGPVHHH